MPEIKKCKWYRPYFTGCFLCFLELLLGTFTYSASTSSSLHPDTPNRPPIEDPAEVHAQIIFPLTGRHIHSPSIVQLPDQTLLASWFYGSGEKTADDVLIQAATGTISLSSGLVKWHEPITLVDTPNFPDLNPVLFVDPHENLWLFWSTVLANEYEYTLIKYKIIESPHDSHEQIDEHRILHVYIPNFIDDFFTGMLALAGHVPDFFPKLMAEIEYKNLEWFVFLLGGLLFLAASAVVIWIKKTRWKFPAFKILICMCLLAFAIKLLTVYLIYEALNDRYLYRMGWTTRSQPLLVENQTILLPIYSDSFSSSLIAITHDKGNTWEFSEPLIGFGNVQPALVQKNDGTIVALMRDNGYYGKIRISRSHDLGKTWSPVESTSIPNPGSSIAVLRLHSGNWILVYNDLLKGKHRLKISLSTDEGETWSRHKYLEIGEKYETFFSYPALTQADDGTIHCVYSYHPSGIEKSIKHVYFSESWLLSEPKTISKR